jgi:hypothetical protein
VFPGLLDLSTAQLELLGRSEDRLDEFVDKLPAVQKLNQDVENVISSNGELASECTLNRSPLLSELWTEGSGSKVSMGQEQLQCFVFVCVERQACVRFYGSSLGGHNFTAV